jgi:hypothetical protein
METFPLWRHVRRYGRKIPSIPCRLAGRYGDRNLAACDYCFVSNANQNEEINTMGKIIVSFRYDRWEVIRTCGYHESLIAHRATQAEAQ